MAGKPDIDFAGIARAVLEGTFRTKQPPPPGPINTINIGAGAGELQLWDSSCDSTRTWCLQGELRIGGRVRQVPMLICLQGIGAEEFIPALDGYVKELRAIIGNELVAAMLSDSGNHPEASAMRG